MMANCNLTALFTCDVITQDEIGSCLNRAIRVCPSLGIVLPVYGSIPHLRNICHSNNIKINKLFTLLK